MLDCSITMSVFVITEHHGTHFLRCFVCLYYILLGNGLVSFVMLFLFVTIHFIFFIFFLFTFICFSYISS